MLFLDEINAANCMALFKTIIIDRMYGNKVIPENAGAPRVSCSLFSCFERQSQDLSGKCLDFQSRSCCYKLTRDGKSMLFIAGSLRNRNEVRIISCCNPYRKRRNKECVRAGRSDHILREDPIIYYGPAGLYL